MTRRQAKRVLITGAIIAPLAVIFIVYFTTVRRTDRQRKEALAALGTPASMELYTDLQTAKHAPTPELLAKSYDLAGFQFTLGEALDHTVTANNILSALRAQVNQEFGQEFQSFQIDPANMREEDYVELEESLIPYRGIYQQALDLSILQGPYYAIDLNQLPNPDMPHHPTVQILAQLVMRFAVLQAHRGDYEEASKSLAAAIHINNKLALDPHLNSQSTQYFIHLEIMKISGHVLPRAGLSESARVRFLHLPDPESYRRSYTDAMRMFSIQISGSLDAVRNRENDAVQNILSGEEYTPALIFYFSLLGRAIMNRDEFHIHTIIHEGNQKLENDTFSQRAYQQSVSERVENLPKQYKYSRQIYLLVSTSLFLRLEMEAQIRLLKLGLAIEAHADEYGQLPETLGEVTSRYSLNEADPFTNIPLRYIVRGDTFLLYSLGRNETDERGTHNLGNGDIVWRGR